MVKRVVIFGGHIQALGLARQIAEKGKEVVLVVEDGCSVARFSRAVDRTIICHNGIVDWSKAISDMELPEKGTLLFPTNDEAVEWLCAHYDEYKTRFALGVPEPKVIELFNNKRAAYQYAAAHKVPCPECWYPDTLEDVEVLSKELSYPVVVKPAVMYSFHATFGKKAFRCDDAASLKATYSRIAAKGYPLETLVVQEFLDGGAKNLYSCGVMAAGGEIIVSMQANRIRQNPMDFGNSTTYAISCFVPEIQEQTEALLRMVGYRGVGEVEWMWDAKSKTYKFLEINTRAWKWHTISNQLNFSFIGELINSFDIGDWRLKIGDLKRNIHADEKQVAWCERLTDWTVVAKEIVHGRMTLKEVCASYKIKHESAVWSWRDPLPAIMYVLLSPILYVKRH